MFRVFSAALDEATTRANGVAALLDNYTGVNAEATLQPALVHRVYAEVAALHVVLFTGILGNPDCGRSMDLLYEHQAPRDVALRQLGDLRRRITAVFMDHFHALQRESLLLSTGRTNIADLLTLCIAATWRISDDISPAALDAATMAQTFACVQDFALVGTEEQLDRPIEALNVHGVVSALFAVYSATPHAHYTAEFERYTRTLLKRALDLLLTPGDQELWNQRDYRFALAEPRGAFRYSALFLRDVTLMWHALSAYFDLAHVLPVEWDPRAVCQPTRQHMAAARLWLRRRASGEQDVWVRDQLVRCSLRAGEMDLYYADHRAQHSVPEIVVRDHRVNDFYRLTEAAPVPPALVAEAHLIADEVFERDGPYAQPEVLHLTLVVMATFRERLSAAAKELRATRFSIMQSDLRDMAAVVRQSQRRPTLVMMYNHLQLWYDGRVLMYNSALESLAAWMLIVDRDMAGIVDSYSVRGLVDDFLRPDETSDQRLRRMAALASTSVPQLGTNGVW